MNYHQDNDPLPKTIYIIDISSINEEYSKNIEEEISKLNFPDLSSEKKREKILIEKKLNSEELIPTSLPQIIPSSNNAQEVTNDSTISSKESTGLNSIISDELETKKQSNLFNPFFSNYCKKSKLYDVDLNFLNFENIIIPQISHLNEELWTYVYPNELKTYFISSCKLLYKNQKMNSLDIKGESNFIKELGMKFCHQTIKVKTESGEESKTCAPDEFLCKDCMKFNKELYNIKDKYLININGRVCKFISGKFHCLGIFLNNGLFETCTTNFICKSCIRLNSLVEFYQ
jgi:hypothetical protein